ncbi:MAG: ZIP family metal transporter [Candidatus Doudnabacteria bacterium]|nr:ZIP family metal transporter [Candidatus Doudnabacteria bacterium]
MSITSLYAIISVIVVSLISVAAVISLRLNRVFGNKTLSFLISFSAGALLGDVFIHLLPELVESGSFDLKISLVILISIIGFFFLERYIHWHHHHGDTLDEHEHAHPHPVAVLNVIGDGVHNLIDGLIIGASYLVSIELGIVTTVAVILHEIPQEIGDFGVLIYAGWSATKAIIFNLLSGLTAVVGAIIAIAFGATELFLTILIALGIGSFIYIAMADLIPEIHKERARNAAMQMVVFVLGIVVMYLLLFLE